MVRPLRPSAILRKAGCGALLVTDVANIRYLTGVSVSAGYALIEAQGITLVVDARYTEKASDSAYSSVAVLSPEEGGKRVGALRICGLESEHVTLERFAFLKKKYKNTKFVQTTGVIAHFRRSKDAAEQRRIKKACAITKRVLRSVPSLLRAGMTERELAWQLTHAAIAQGAQGLAFDPIVGFGEHTSRPHHEPDDTPLSSRDIVQLDFGVRCEGYCSDVSRVYFLGAPTAEQASCLRILKKAKRAAEDTLRPGAVNHAADRAARSVLRAHGLDEAFTHALGHGLGLDIHEGITLSARAPRMTLLRGEAVTIEPGIYFPGKWGMRLEDTHIVG